MPTVKLDQIPIVVKLRWMRTSRRRKKNMSEMCSESETDNVVLLCGVCLCVMTKEENYSKKEKRRMKKKYIYTVRVHTVQRHTVHYAYCDMVV